MGLFSNTYSNQSSTPLSPEAFEDALRALRDMKQLYGPDKRILPAEIWEWIQKREKRDGEFPTIDHALLAYYEENAGDVAPGLF